MNSVAVAFELLFVPLTFGVVGALVCAWRDRRAEFSHQLRHQHSQASTAQRVSLG